MYLIHLAYQTSKHSLVYIKPAQNIHSGAKSSKTKPILYKVYNILWTFLNTVVKVKNTVVLSVSIIYPCDQVADWELRNTATAQHNGRVSHTISLPQENIKIQNSKYNFHWMCIAFTLP